MAITISTDNLNQIKRVMAYPSVDNIILTDDQIKTFCVQPALEEYFGKFPYKVTTEYSLTSGSETEIDYPDEYTFGATNVKVVDKNNIGSGSSFWDLVYFNQSGISTRQSGMYGVKGYNPGFSRQVNIQKKQELGTYSNLGTINSRVDHDSRKVYIYTTVGGKANITWAKYSHDFSTVRFTYKWDVIKLAQAHLLQHLADTTQIVTSPADIEINSAELKARAEELFTEIRDKWAEFPDVIALRVV